jgi:hypothetical protein
MDGMMLDRFLVSGDPRQFHNSDAAARVRQSMLKMIFALAAMLRAAAMADETVHYEEKAFYPCDKSHTGWSTPTVDPENDVRHLIEDHPMTKSGEFWKVVKVENIHRQDEVMPGYTVPECRATVRTDHGDFDYDWFFVSDDRGSTWTISGTLIRLLSK